MADIFISYASEDRERIEPLVVALQHAGFSVWWDRKLRGGSMFSHEIENEVQASAATIVVWTEHSLKSRWVADEVDLALNAEKLVPVKFGEVTPPIGYRQVQTISFDEWAGAEMSPSFQSLKTAVRHLVDAKQVDAPAQPSSTSKVQTPTAVHEASIAVLPFVNMSSDPEQEFFSDGISEELLNLLAKIKQMQVAARTSSFQFKGQNQDISEIAGMLGVAHILEGSVRKAGNRVRITAQLIHAENGFHMWSETYDRTLDDIFAIQDEISEAIVEALKEHILGEVEAPHVERAVNVEAYEHFLLGQQLVNKRSPAAIEESRKCFTKALGADPEYSPAMVSLAETHILLCDAAGSYGGASVADAVKAAGPLLDRALELDPDSEDAYCVRSFFHMISGNQAKAVEDSEKAVSLNPNFAKAYHTLGLSLSQSGDPRAPVFFAKKMSVQLDPVSPFKAMNFSSELAIRHRFDEAHDVLERARKIDNASPHIHNAISLIEALKGNFANLVKNSFDGRSDISLAMVGFHLQGILTEMGYGPEVEGFSREDALYHYASLGLRGNANRIGVELLLEGDASGSYEDTLAIALWHVVEGRNDKALELLRPFDEDNPDKWGIHFSMEEECLGARLKYQALSATGRTEEAGKILERLEETVNFLNVDPDGAQFFTEPLTAFVAMGNGKVNEALEAMEARLGQSFFGARAMINEPIFRPLADNPAFQEICTRVEDHAAQEKQKAMDAGLLPPPEDLLDAIAR